MPVVEEISHSDHASGASETIPHSPNPQHMISSSVSGLPLSPIKLFDVSVAVDENTNVKIQVTDHDDPWALARLFQDEYNISNKVTGELY